MDDEKRLARLEKKRGRLISGELNLIKNTRRARRITEGIADILERRRLEAMDPAHVAKKIIEMGSSTATSLALDGVKDAPLTAPFQEVPEQPNRSPKHALTPEAIPVGRKIAILAASLSPEKVTGSPISMIEDDRLTDVKDLLLELAVDPRGPEDPSFQEDLLALKQVVQRLPFEKGFREVFDNYITVQLHRERKGPAFIPKV